MRWLIRRYKSFKPPLVYDDYMKKTLKVSEEDGVVRVDKYMANTFPEYSRAAIAKLFTLNLIKREGVPLRAGEKLRPGAKIEYDLGPLQAKPEVIPLPVIYEDEQVIVVDKPAGIISHARGKFWQEASVASFIRDKVSSSQDPHSERAGIVHRLDRATSGVMICAKNTESLKYLQKQFSDRTVAKKYIAIVVGSLEHPTAVIEAPIMRNNKDPKKFMVHKDGKKASTEYTVLASDDVHSRLELTPHSGRTHQLRLHLLHINKPIVGDELYGGESADRLMLHAHSLSIMLPGGTEKTFTSKLPEEFSNYASK